MPAPEERLHIQRITAHLHLLDIPHTDLHRRCLAQPEHPLARHRQRLAAHQIHPPFRRVRPLAPRQSLERRQSILQPPQFVTQNQRRVVQRQRRLLRLRILARQPRPFLNRLLKLRSRLRMLLLLHRLRRSITKLPVDKQNLPRPRLQRIPHQKRIEQLPRPLLVTRRHRLQPALKLRIHNPALRPRPFRPVRIRRNVPLPLRNRLRIPPFLKMPLPHPERSRLLPPHQILSRRHSSHAIRHTTRRRRPVKLIDFRPDEIPPRRHRFHIPIQSVQRPRHRLRRQRCRSMPRKILQKPTQRRQILIRHITHHLRTPRKRHYRHKLLMRTP